MSPSPRLFWVVVLFIGATSIFAGVAAFWLAASSPGGAGGQNAGLISAYLDVFKLSVATLLGLVGGRSFQ